MIVRHNIPPTSLARNVPFAAYGQGPEAVGAGAAAWFDDETRKHLASVAVGVSVYVITRILDRVLFGGGKK